MERSASPLRSVGLPDPWHATSAPVPALVATAREGGPPGHDLGRVAVGRGAPVIQRYWYRGANGVVWRPGEPGDGVEPTEERYNTNVHGEGPVYVERSASKPKRGYDSRDGPSPSSTLLGSPTDENKRSRKGELPGGDAVSSTHGGPESVEERVLNNPGTVESLFSHLRYSDLGTMMQVNKQSLRVAQELTAPRTVRGLSPGAYYGMLKAVGNTSKEGAIHAGADPPTGHDVAADAWPADQATTEDVVRALGWREHLSPPGKKEGGGSRTLNEFAARAREHAEVTSRLRSGSRAAMYPSSAMRSSDETEMNGNLNAVGTHWGGVLSSALGKERKHDDLDVEALELFDAHTKGQPGQNLSVAKDRPPGSVSEAKEKKLYSNQPLPLDKADAIRAKGYDLAEQDRSEWGPPEGYSRMDFGNGPRTPANRSIPFHSEMQRLRTLEPWQLGYSGNHYLACPQCAMGYHAIGVEEFRGTHGQKSESVIPQKIRENSVYLSRYLGSETFEKMKEMDAPSAGKLLHRVERGDSSFFDKAGVTLPPGVRKGLWGSEKDPRRK